MRTPVFPTVSGGPKRIVFIHGNLTLICGLLTELPVTLPPFEVLGETIPFASLVKVTSRAAYYKAPHVPQSFRPSDKPLFDARQR